MSKIKSILIALMCLVVCLAFAACGNKPADDSTSEPTSVSTIEPSDSNSEKEPESKSESENVSVCNHNFVLKTETAPDCEHAGKKVLKCDKCGEEKTEVGEAALGHIFGDWEVVNAETCTVDGEKARYCTRDDCDGMETAKIPAAHKYALNDEDGVAPTCETVGKDVYECSVCHDKYDEVVPALGHKENTSIARVVTEATCESIGYTTLTCERCEKTYDIDEVDALGHNYEAETTENATCAYAGYVVMKCSRCDKSYRDVTAEKLSHSFGDDGVCGLCGKSYLEANALFVSSEDNKAYAVKDEAYDYLIYAKDDTSYETTVTIDREIVDRLIANRYYKINFMFGSPDKYYRAMGYKLPGDENFRYVNVFAVNGFGDNTLFSLVIGDENGADEAVVTDEGIVLTFLYRYKGSDGVTVDTDEEKYHGTLDRFALKITYEYTPKPFDYEDKTTWLKSVYSIAYDETNARFEVTDGDPGTEQIEQDITLTAGLLSAMKAQKKGSFIITMMGKDNQFSILGMKISAWQYCYPDSAQPNPTSNEILITDDMLTNGFTFRGLYADKAQRDKLTGYDQSNGFYFTIEFFKEFDPETDAPISAGAEYEYADGIYTFNARDVRVKVLGKAIAYWMNNGYTSIDIIVMDKEGEGQRASKNTQIEGVDNGTNEAVQTVNVVLTEEMKTNGLSMILYWNNISWIADSNPDGIRLQIVAKK